MPSIAPLGDRLNALRRRLGFTQLELAGRSGVSERTIRNAEQGRPIKRDFLEYIAAGLGVSVDDVIYVSPELSSPFRWQQNLENLMTSLRGVFSENPRLDVLAFAHPEMTCHVQGSIPGLAREEQLFGEFQGAARIQQLLGAVRILRREYGDVYYYLEKPVGGGDSVVIRCSLEVPLRNGGFYPLRSVSVCEFEMFRLKRVDVYIAPGAVRALESHETETIAQDADYRSPRWRSLQAERSAS